MVMAAPGPLPGPVTFQCIYVGADNRSRACFVYRCSVFDAQIVVC
jgi:hypothetical protein